MPVYYIRKIMFYGAIDMTAQTTRAKIAIGYHIGHSRAEETTPQHKNGYTVQRCRCDCGGEIDAPLHQLTAGYRKSCGCLQENLKLCEGTSVTILEAGRRRLRPTNTSGVTGVYRNRRTGRWCAQITFKRKTYYLGAYEKKDDAIGARKRGEGLHENFIAWYYASHQLTEGRP